MHTSWRASASTFSRRASLLLAATLLSASGTGCSTLRYLLQATEGQLALINHAKPIPEVVKDPKTPPRIARLLSEIPDVKRFGELHGLKPTTNYTEYVKLDRPAAVWVVSACEPLEFKSREWKFPVVGSFPYLGWFDLKAANEYAEELRKENLDVDVRGAGAYSTLGWFRDAVLSSMIPDGEQALGDLANVVIHESVHATVYIDGQAYFNESVANFVADRLTEIYLDTRAGASPAPVDSIAKRPEVFKESAFGAKPAGAARAVSAERLAYLGILAEGEGRRKRLHEAYESLKTLYASTKPASEKLEQKKKLLDALKAELKFRRDINNAMLIQFKTYNTGSNDFEALWKTCGDDSARFMRAVGTLKKSSFQKPQQSDLAPVLGALATAGCPG